MPKAILNTVLGNFNTSLQNILKFIRMFRYPKYNVKKIHGIL